MISQWDGSGGNRGGRMMRLLCGIGDGDGYVVVHLSRMRNQTEKDVGMRGSVSSLSSSG